ncbi:MAG: hypothetical protein HYZ11_04130 [Candidatus Tectomicrobia bacterium]|uniref:Uncharacterized protein n=1 Tax=Tectimicrobiota bacterium TaxID=2528274 RepID=A0A932ML46_UNCTE|nr:hypothetical protein [Candidatus Tectomicrobia bacterium]
MQKGDGLAVILVACGLWAILVILLSTKMIGVLAMLFALSLGGAFFFNWLGDLRGRSAVIGWGAVTIILIASVLIRLFEP